MYHLKRMIECVRIHGIGCALDGNKLTHDDDTEQFLEKQFYHYVEQCHVFVFQPKNSDKELKDAPHASVELDAPFKIFSIEIAGANQFITIGASNSEMYSIGNDEKRVIFDVPCMMLVETTPRNFLCYVHYQVPGSNGERVIVDTHMTALAKEFIDRINSEETGLQKIKERVKIGKGSEKRQTEIRRIIHVSPKKKRESVKSEYTSPIDWSHRFMVRGHWRDLSENQVGKDRSGDYCVTGMTWVVEHEKGPDEAPLVHKVRVVAGS